MNRSILLSCFVFVVSFVTAQTKADLEKKKSETLQEIQTLNRQYDDIKKSKKESLGQLALIQNKIKLRDNVISSINDQLLMIGHDIDSSYREMVRLKKDLGTLRENYAHSVVYAYKNRSGYDFLNFIFSATSFNDAIRRIAYMRAYRNYRARQLESIFQTEALYKGKIEDLKKGRDEKSSVLDEQAKAMDELMKDKQEKDRVVGGLKKKEGEINKMIAAKRKQSKEIEAAIKAVVRREIDLAKKEAEKKAKEEKKVTAEKTTKETTTKTTETTTKTTTPKKQASYLEYNKEDIALGASFETNKGKLPYPVDNGYVAIGFGTYTVPGTNITGSQDFITIASPVGTSVKAVFSGEVVSVFDVGGMFAVMLKHGKYFTTYSNLKSASVSKGQQVSVGQQVGLVGANLEGEGQLDFILTKESTMLNPQSWLRSK